MPRSASVLTSAVANFIGTRGMFGRVCFGSSITVLAILSIAFAMPAFGSSPEADALAQKFIDGPRQEADLTRKNSRLEKMRSQELDALSEKLRRVRERRLGQIKQEPNGPEAEESAGLRGFSQWSEPAVPKGPELEKQIRHQRVAVLLSMQPGRRRSRRFERTAEPIICLERRCFIGAGAEQRAVEMPRRRALGPSNALASRAGACRHMSRCVFRSVPLSPSQAWLQPVDLGWVRHDRREPVAIAADPTCRIVKQRQSCDRAISGPDYRLWLVPEAFARRAGSVLLRQALASGLRPVRKQASLGQSGLPSHLRH